MGKRKTRTEIIIEIRKFAVNRLFVDQTGPECILGEIHGKFGFLVSEKTLKRRLERFENGRSRI